MKKLFIITLMGLLLSVGVMAQHTYAIKITPTTSKVKIDSCVWVFNDLRVKSCTYVEKLDLFLIESKNFLPKLILVDYFGGYGFNIVEWSEDVKDFQMYIMPKKKE